MNRHYHSRGLFAWLDPAAIRSAIGLNMGSTIAFCLGVICLLAALSTGFIFSASTLVDWQAVQIWRTEWLLAAIATFAAGILLKRPQS